jgi:hypothetical protein
MSRMLAFADDDDEDGDLARLEVAPFPGESRSACYLFDGIEEALESEAPDEHEVWDNLRDAGVPYMQQLDWERLAKIYKRRREAGISRWDGYPDSAEGRIEYHRARDRGQPGTLTPKEWLAIRVAWQGRCAYCSCDLPKPTIEHVKPVCAGGKTEFSNIVPSCWACNKSKETKTAESWLGGDYRRFLQRWARAKARARRWLRSRKPPTVRAQTERPR